MHRTGSTHAAHEIANDRMKRRSEQWLPRAIVIAVVLHFALFNFGPTMRAAAFASADAPEIIVMPPDVDIPPPPDRIARPATPVLSTADISDDITISDTSFDAWVPDTLVAPVRTTDRAQDDFEAFTHMMIAPELLNVAEVERALERAYPPLLRDAGIGGQVDVNLWLDDRGRIVKAQIARSSGYELMDAAALEVVDVMRLTPAQNRGVPVKVIVSLPVIFTVK